MIPDFADYNESNISDCIFSPGDILTGDNLILIFKGLFEVRGSTYGGFKYYGIESYIIFNKSSGEFEWSLERGNYRAYKDYINFKYSSKSDEALLLKAMLSKDLYWDSDNLKIINLNHD